MKQSDFLQVTTSWDDGHENDVHLAGLLTKYHMKGTFYLTKTYLQPLSEEKIIEISRNHEIGAHTLTHPTLTEIALEEAEKEITGSKIYLENILNHPVIMFCYPRGKYNEEIKNIVKKSGFIAARTLFIGSCNEAADPFEWPVTVYASNGSPRQTFNLWKKNHLSIKSLFDWEIRAKMLFDMALETGGVYHIWGHSWEFEQKNEWEKIERVFNYIANRKNVLYRTNSQIFLDSDRSNFDQK
jgi:peptidoglycan/xylan/chitin deacetylase (PgdA/CDA1 family)